MQLIARGLLLGAIDSLESLKRSFQVFLESIRHEGCEVLVVSHYDADGLSSFSILAYFLKRNNIPFHATFVEQVYPETLNQIPLEAYPFVIFLDLGSGYKHLIREKISGKTKVLIIDHHIPSDSHATKELVEINPYLAGLNGSEETSASTLTYYFLRDYPEVRKVIHLAVVGALGDRLDNGDNYSFKGINKEVLEEALREKIIQAAIGIRLFGGASRPIVQALANTVDPFIPGLSGNESACYSFLKKIGIEPKQGDTLRSLGSLTSEETANLATELVKYMILSGVSVKDAQRIIGYNYYLLSEKPESPLRDLREYSSLLNALGRLDAYGTALAINLGYRGVHLARAEAIAREYRRILARLINTVNENFDKISLHGRETLIIKLEEATPKLSGPLASILASTIANKLQSKKIIGVAVPYSDKKFKVSFRRLVDNIDVGGLLQQLSRKLGFDGGGHPAAGGALLDEEKIKELLKTI